VNPRRTVHWDFAQLPREYKTSVPCVECDVFHATSVFCEIYFLRQDSEGRKELLVPNVPKLATLHETKKIPYTLRYVGANSYEPPPKQAGGPSATTAGKKQ